jgi:hypothetical protein
MTIKPRFIKKKELFWNCGDPVWLLPEKIAKIFREYAEFLYHDLKENKQKVVLIDPPDKKHSGHKMRTLETKPPKWFSELYLTKNIKKKKNSEKLSGGGSLRYDVLLGLTRIIENRDCRNSLMMRLRELILERLVNGYESENGFVPPDDLIREIFNEKEEDIFEF